MAQFSGQNKEGVETATRSSRSANGSTKSDRATTNDYSLQYLGSSSTDVTPNPYEGDVGTSTRQNIVGATGSTAKDYATTISGSYRDTYDRRTVDYASAVGDDNRGFAKTATIIPTALFRRVVGTALDEDGNPIENAINVVSVDNFGIVGGVDGNGVFDIFLLRQEYSQFFTVVSDLEDNDANYVYYALNNGQSVSTGESATSIKFNTEATFGDSGKPLSLSINIGFG